MAVRLLTRDTFHSDWRIANVTAPLLLLHGERDPAIPIALGEKPHRLARDPKQMVRFRDGGHETLDDFGATDVVRRSLAKPAA